MITEQARASYEQEIKKFRNNCIERIEETLRNRGYRISNKDLEILEKLGDLIAQKMVQASEYHNILSQLDDITFKTKNQENPAGYFEYNLNEIKQKTKRVAIYDSFAEVRSQTERSLMVDERTLDEVIYELKRVHDKLCNGIGDLNNNLIMDVQKQFNNSLQALNNNRTLDPSQVEKTNASQTRLRELFGEEPSMASQIAAQGTFGNMPQNPQRAMETRERLESLFGPSSQPTLSPIEQAERDCKEAFNRVRNGVMTNAQAMELVSSTLSMLPTLDAYFVACGLQWELPANNPELDEFIKLKQEEFKELKEEEKKQSGPASQFL